MNRRLIFRALTIISLTLPFFFATRGIEALAQTELEVFIQSSDLIGFPEIDLDLRVVDGTGTYVPGLTQDNFVLYENGNPVDNFTITGTEAGRKHIVFLFDMGLYSNLFQLEADIQAAMRLFAQDYFNEQTTTVSIIGRINTGEERTIQILAPTSSVSDFTTAIDALDFDAYDASNRQLERFSGVQEAVTLIGEMTAENPRRFNTAIFYFTRQVEGVQSLALQQAAPLAESLAEQHLPVYVLHTDREGLYAGPLQRLAEVSHGEYLPFRPGNVNLGELAALYARIEDNGRIYRFAYRSTSGVSGERRVAVVPIGLAEDQAVDFWSYSIQLEDPLVRIVSPETAVVNITRSIVRDPSGAFLEYSTPNVPIIAELQDWPDGIERGVASASLIVNEQTIQTIYPDPTSQRMEFLHDLSEVTTATSQTIYIRLVDELGRIGISPSISLSINIESPEEIIFPTLTPLPTPTVTETAAAATLTYAPWVALIVVIVLLITTRRQVSTLANSAGKAIYRGTQVIRKTLLGERAVREEAIAFLHVLIAGPDHQGGVIKIFNDRTTIGRDPGMSDIQLYDAGADSSVSGQHCTFIFDQGRFLITDDNSKNGVMINNKKIPPNDPTGLNDGDEIILGDVYRGGAKLRFEIAAGIPSTDESLKGPTQIDRDDGYFDEDLVEFDEDASGGDGGDQNLTDELRGKYKKTVPGYRDEDLVDEDIFDEFDDESDEGTARKDPKEEGDDDWLNQLG